MRLKLSKYVYFVSNCATLREKAHALAEEMWANVGIKHLLFVLYPVTSLIHIHLGNKQNISVVEKAPILFQQELKLYFKSCSL